MDFGSLCEKNLPQILRVGIANHPSSFSNPKYFLQCTCFLCRSLKVDYIVVIKIFWNLVLSSSIVVVKTAKQKKMCWNIHAACIIHIMYVWGFKTGFVLMTEVHGEITLVSSNVFFCFVYMIMKALWHSRKHFTATFNVNLNEYKIHWCRFLYGCCLNFNLGCLAYTVTCSRTGGPKHRRLKEAENSGKEATDWQTQDDLIKVPAETSGKCRRDWRGQKKHPEKGREH